MKTLQINIDELEDAAQPWEADLPRELLEEVLAGPPATEYTANGASHLKARLTKMGRKLLAQGKFVVPLLGQCKRCLKPVTLDEPVDFTLTYVPREVDTPVARKRYDADDAKATKKRRDKDDDRDDSPAAASFDLGTLDDEHYTNKTIDLAPAMREQVLLALPPSPLCDEECKGLCPKCGKDLNEGDCGCDRRIADPRWAALKQVQLDKKE